MLFYGLTHNFHGNMGGGAMKFLKVEGTNNFCVKFFFALGPPLLVFVNGPLLKQILF